MPPDDQIVRRLVEQWVEKARQDLLAARALLGEDPPLLYPSCFHAQQSAEKYLKALLTWRQVEFPKTHSIRELLNLAEGSDPELAHSLRGAAALTVYGVEARYPGDLPEPNRDQTETALYLAERVRERVLGVLPSA